MLEKELDKKKYELRIISVWKFADDAPSLHRKIVREVERKLDLVDPESLDVSTTEEESIKANGLLSSLTLLKRLGNLKSIVIWNIIIFIILALFKVLLPSVLTSLATTATTLIIISLVTVLLAKSSVSIISSIKNIKTNLPLNYGDQYENRFKKVVDNYLGKKTDKKLILVFDDLDRLPPKQLYGALNTIKTFLSSDRCAFIIPCDENVLKEELKEAFDKKAMTTFDVGEYLNKTFDVTVRLPKLEPVNMRKYATSLIERENVVWYRENKDKYHEVLSILIHSVVLTPRHVKKNINTFATDWELAKKRDKSNKHGKFLSVNPEILAVYSVLKADFSDFYNLIMEDPFLIRDIAEIEEKKEEILKNTNDSEGLESFLSKVDTLIPEDPRPYIYFNNEELNPLTGRLDLEKLKKYMINGQKQQFSSLFNDINKDEMHLVISSLLSDISSKLETEKFFSILFTNKELTQFIDPEDKMGLTDLIKNNMSSIMKYRLEDTLTVFDEIVDKDVIWRMFGELLENDKNKYKELLDVHIKSPQLIEKLQINSIFDDVYTKNALEIGRSNGDCYYLPKVIMQLPKDHPLVAKINWFKTLENSLTLVDFIRSNNEGTDEEIGEELKNNLEEVMFNFNLASWITTVKIKSNQSITNKQINLILELYDFIEYDNLDSIVGVWINQFECGDSGDEGDLIKFLSIIEEHLTNIATVEELNKLGKLNNYDNSEILRKQITDIIEYSKTNEDEADFINILHAFKETSMGAEFSINNFAFNRTKINDKLTEILLHRDNYFNQTSLDTIINRANSEIFTSPECEGIYIFTELLQKSKVWLSAVEKRNITWFNIKTEPFLWFKWNIGTDNFEERLKIYYELNKNRSDLWSNLIFSLSQVALLGGNFDSMGTNYPYRGQGKIFLNKCFDFMINNCLSEEVWKEVLNKHLTIIPFLDKKEISNFISKVPKVVSFNNSELNDLIIKNATIENTTHLNHLINRFEFFTESERLQVMKDIPSDKKELLLNHIKDNPELKLIDEIANYDISESFKTSIMVEISSKSDATTLNLWIDETLKMFINSDVTHWRMATIKYILSIRTDVEKPKLDLLERLLEFKDNRTELALNFVLNLFPKNYRNKSEFNKIRMKTLILERDEVFRELVLEIKEKFKWRNNVLV